MRLAILLSILCSHAFGQTQCSTTAQAPVTCQNGYANTYQHTHPDLTLPTGIIILKTSGTCDTGWTEVTALNGKLLRGTVAANGNVGTTGGNSTITPAGTVQQASFTGTPITTVINHTHPTTVTVSVQGGTTAATTGTHVMTSTATGGSVRAIAAGDNAAGSTSNPAGGVASITPAGTINAQSFTGQAVDPTPPYVNVIFCSKN